jgi:protein O-mannosyl-transferase
VYYLTLPWFASDGSAIILVEKDFILNDPELKKSVHSFAEKTEAQKAQQRLAWKLAGLAAFLTFLFYLPTLSNDFVNWDDPAYILNNPRIRNFSLDSISWLFSNLYKGFYIPLTGLSLAFDFMLGGPNPRIFHLHNLILHLLNTILVFFLCLKILNLSRRNNTPENEKQPSKAWIMPASFLTAVLFGLHPIHVESVAWATERKDLLNGFFFFL